MTRFGLATILVALALPACGIGESVAGRCVVENDAFETAQNKRSGLLERGISRQDAAFRAASEGVARAQQALRACEDGRGKIGVFAAESSDS
jgi:hypothetical protein